MGRLLCVQAPVTQRGSPDSNHSRCWSARVRNPSARTRRPALSSCNSRQAIGAAFTTATRTTADYGLPVDADETHQEKQPHKSLHDVGSAGIGQPFVRVRSVRLGQAAASARVVCDHCNSYRASGYNCLSGLPQYWQWSVMAALPASVPRPQRGRGIGGRRRVRLLRGTSSVPCALQRRAGIFGSSALSTASRLVPLYSHSVESGAFAFVAT